MIAAYSEEVQSAQQSLGIYNVLRHKLLAADSPFVKSYLNILVDEIVVQEKKATIMGSYEALAETMQ